MTVLKTVTTVTRPIMIHHTSIGGVYRVSLSGDKKFNLDKNTTPTPPTSFFLFLSYKKPTPIGGWGYLILILVCHPLPRPR